MAGAVSSICDGHGAIGMSPSLTQHVGAGQLLDVWFFSSEEVTNSVHSQA